MTCNLLGQTGRHTTWWIAGGLYDTEVHTQVEDLQCGSHNYARWLLGNKVNARRHVFRCLLAFHINLSLISALVASLTNCHNQHMPKHACTLTVPVTPPTSTWKKAFYGQT